MATKLYTEDINKYVDWGGDKITKGLPVSGEKVQKFIKESLEGKFGFMYYDKDAKATYQNITVAEHTATNQYIIFADKENFAKWAAAPADNAALILGQFDAPAPATIEIKNAGSYTKTLLLSDKDNQEISFNYVVKDKSDHAQAGESTISISINNNISGTKVLPTIRVNIPSDAVAGVDYVFDKLGDYLLEGVNTINFTITSLMFNVSTTITYQYKVLDLNLSSTFGNNTSDFNYYNGISLDDNEFFVTSIVATGAGNKFLRVFIDGNQVEVYDTNNHEVLDLFIGASNPSNYDVVIPFIDSEGELKEWATFGKHNLQMYFYMFDENRAEIKSQTLYYDFVLTQRLSTQTTYSYILFQRVFENNSFTDIVTEGQDPSILPQGSTVTINSEQYFSFDVDYAVYNTAGRGDTSDGSAITVDIKLFDKTDLIHPENGNGAGATVALPSSTGSTFTYNSQNYGKKELHLSTKSVGAVRGETIVIDVNIKKSSVEISKVSQGLQFEFSALNRSNSESSENRSIWKYEKTLGTQVTTYQAEFNKVLWNNQNGWIDNCLVLNNGATVTIPANIFGLYQNGLTFEIDFETENVQDDDAIVMSYGSLNENNELNGQGILIKACSATLQSANGINIHTNYKDGSRQKIQFIFSYNRDLDQLPSNIDCPYLMYMVVNGILDRVIQFTSNDNCDGTNEIFNQFTIGNTDGKVTTKIHSIRGYTKALTLDECVDNFIADSDKVRETYLRNDIYNAGSKTINVNKILSADLHIPVMTIYGDITNSIVQVFNKKSNVPVDILYQDPMHPEFNYFARDAWMSNQGTSSMNYPRRNLRLYFNKGADANTMRGYASNARYNYQTRVWWGLTDEDMISKIQQGQITDLDAPFKINNDTYQALTNKKTLSDKPQIIDYDTAIMFVHSGIKIYKDVACTKKIKNLNEYINEYEAEHQNQNAPIYVQGAFARYKNKDLYTDRWTLKCDYAESSMCHNAGIGRLWGDVMRDVEVGTEGFTYDIAGNKIQTSKPGMTNAQRAVAEYNETHEEEFGDIRTSCDGYPIIIVNHPRIKGENGQYTESYGDPVFLGLYNIMTDKGSTPLFGFEDLKDEDGNTIFDAGNDEQRTECWECLQNGSKLAQMSTVVTDTVDGSRVPYTPGTANNKDREIFKTYEARWPDNDDLNDTKTNKLETVIRFVQFCKDALSVKVGAPGTEKDGYELSDFTPIPDPEGDDGETEGTAKYYSHHLDQLTNHTLYIGLPSISWKDKYYDFCQTDTNGNVLYGDNNTELLLDINDAKAKLYKKGLLVIYYKQTYDAQNVGGDSFEAVYKEDDSDDVKIQKVYELLNAGIHVYTASEDESQIEQVAAEYYEGSGRQWYIYDKSYNRNIITKTINTAPLKDDVYTGKVYTYDGKRVDANGEQLHQDAWVTVYLTKNGNNYTYVNELGETVRYASGEEVVEMLGSGNTISGGSSFKGHTLFEYFQDQKYEHFDIWKLACYYVYLMRFAAVDQVIKNTMMTTEDGIHYYFINYDNDTTLGVRNDGYLAYDWQIDRETYDESIGSYAYAGFGSVLWNLLEQDKDFLNKVKTVATAMVTSNVLTYDIAVDMFNNKQAGTWSERLYNNSEMYKYIGIYTDADNEGTNDYNPYQNTKYLPFLQGSRSSHRDWWLRHRFDLYDSKWSAGEYATNRLDFYMGLEASPNNRQPFLRIVPGSKFYYSIISNNNVLGNNFVELTPGTEIIAGQEQDKSYTFTTTETLILGNPMQMYGVYKAKVLDFSVNRQGLGQKLSCNWSKEKGSLIEELILGGDKPTSEIPGCAVTEISNIDRLSTLKKLDIRTCSLMKSIDISQLGNLRQFLADGSAITNFIPAKGVMLEKVSLPSSITTLKLNGISLDEFIFEPSVALTRVEIENVEGTALEGHKLFEFILKWYVMLMKADVLMSNYSCALSFNRIDLEQFYGGEDAEITNDITEWIASIPANLNISAATKKIKSLDLLNAIKKDFGLNNIGGENFVINKGVIKLYGDAETGGLTYENYTDMLTKTYKNGETKLWSETTFRADSSFHFDSESSVFVTITPYESNKEIVADEDQPDTYTMICGQRAKITTTIFPINNERVITMIPWSKSLASNTLQRWTLNDGNYRYAFGQNQEYSYFSNDNGTAILDIYEYINSSIDGRFVQIQIFDSLNTNNTGSIKTLMINLERMVSPSGSDIRFNYNDNQIIKTQEISEVQDYEYELSFDQDEEHPINVDILNINGSFNSDTVVNDNEYGTINGVIEENEDGTKTYKLIYHPNIQNTDTTIPIYAFIQLDDRNKTIIKNSFNVRLKTTLINDIQLSGNNVQEDENTNELLIEQYVKNTTDIQNGKVSYPYQININPTTGYNVTIASMNIVIPDEYMSSGYNIVETRNSINNKIIDSITIELQISKKSIYEIGKFEIVIVDIFGNETRKTVNVKLGCFYPDEIRLIRKLIDNNNVETVDETTNSNSLSLLRASTPTVKYILRVYSNIYNQLYVWDINNEFNSTDPKSEKLAIGYLTPNQLPNAEYSSIQFDIPSNGVTNNLADYITVPSVLGTFNSDNQFNGTSISDTNRFEITFTQNSTIEAWEAGVNVKYSVTFNKVTRNYNNNIMVYRTSAIEQNFNIQSNVIIPFEAGTTNTGIYYLDKKLNLYNPAGLAEQKDKISIDIKDYIIALIFVYIDQNSNKTYVSLDPWKLGKAVKWWSDESTWYNEPNYGERLRNHVPYFKLLGINSGSNNYDIFNNFTEAQIFKAFYDYYRILCSSSTNEEKEGGRFILEGTMPENPTLDDKCNAYYNGNLRFTNSSEVIDEDMIFYYINDYKKYSLTNYICMPLSSNEVSCIMNHYDVISEGLDRLYKPKTGESTLSTLLFDISKYKGSKMDNPNGYGLNYQTYQYSKLFWFFDIPSMDIPSGYKNIENMQVRIHQSTETSDINNGDIVIQVNNESTQNLVGPQLLNYCLFGIKSIKSL